MKTPQSSEVDSLNTPQQEQLEEGMMIQVETKPAVMASPRPGRWTTAEHELFLKGMRLYGREWKRVAQHIPTRSAAQVRSHAQKYLTKLQRRHEEEEQLSCNPQVERILAEPESVRRDVEETMERLRERYRVLQQRLQQQSQQEQNSDEQIALDVLRDHLPNKKPRKK